MPEIPVQKRSVGALKTRRVQLEWPKDQAFRILSIDGGGIRGVFPATLLAGLEGAIPSGRRIADYFDLIAGTSTGGIIALALASGLPASDVRDLYVDRGAEIFPPEPNGAIGTITQKLHALRRLVRYRYDREVLARLLHEQFGERTLGESSARLCVPSVDGRFGETYIFKTPHHPDFKKDASEPITKVAASTAAAPTFFRPLEDGGYAFLDGGLFANDPIMVALVDALSCFAVSRSNVRILSIGCGSAPYRITKRQRKGGRFAWRNAIEGAIHFQSLNAQGQASLLIGADQITRVVPSASAEDIALDDWRRSVEELGPEAATALDRRGPATISKFLSQPAAPYTPFPTGRQSPSHLSPARSEPSHQ